MNDCYLLAMLALPVTFPCSFEKPLAVNQKSRIKKEMYCMCRRIKKEEDKHTFN